MKHIPQSLFSPFSFLFIYTISVTLLIFIILPGLVFEISLPSHTENWMFLFPNLLQGTASSRRENLNLWYGKGLLNLLPKKKAINWNAMETILHSELVKIPSPIDLETENKSHCLALNTYRENAFRCQKNGRKGSWNGSKIDTIYELIACATYTTRLI